MFNRTTVANVFAAAACALVIALSIIGMGVNSSWAGPDQPQSLLQHYAAKLRLAQAPLCSPECIVCTSNYHAKCIDNGCQENGIRNTPGCDQMCYRLADEECHCSCTISY
jgi:hypothetical protein